MDLLGSILNSMDKRPVSQVNKEKQKQLKQQQEVIRKAQEADKKKLRDFSDKCQQRINDFIDNDNEKNLKFSPYEKVYRSIIHDLAETADLVAFSFGVEGVDRHTILYKKEHVPCEDELAALRRGEIYDPEKAALQRLQQAQEERQSSRKERIKIDPSLNYQEKYKHLIGKEAGKDAAKETGLNAQFGFVPSSLKRDQRSIEDTLNDIRRKKLKQKEEIDETDKADD